MAVGNNNQIEKRLWDAADELRANSKLKSSEYSIPVLGLIFLRYADHKFSAAQKELEGKGTGRRQIGKSDYQAKGVLYLPDTARFQKLLKLPEGTNIGQAINDAMRAIELENPDLKDVLPKTYNRLENSSLVELLKIMASIPMDIEGDAFGKIYEYFLGKFAMAEGQKGGEFFTPTAIVKLIVEILEPFHGRVYDPCCGSGGMFVQSARFVEEHRKTKPSSPSGRGVGGEGGSEGTLSIYGQERVAETVRLNKMNLAVHGLAGDIRQGNTYYEDLHNSPGKFDFVLANPPFNVDRVDKDRLKDDPRFPLGLPKVDNANYLWIQIFYSALNKKGRAGFVMANSAADARASELEIRKKLIQDKAVDVMVAVGPNMFYTVTLPCMLWFLDKGKSNLPPSPKQAPSPAFRHPLPVGEGGGEGEASIRTRDTVLFIDARHIYNQIDRAHREFTPQQIEFLANIVRLYRGEKPENKHESAKLMAQYGFIPSTKKPPSPKQAPSPAFRHPLPVGEGRGEGMRYVDVPGLCKVATIKEIEAQGWSLNPGRYVGVAEGEADDFNFKERLQELNEELERLNVEARELEERISENVAKLLEAKS